MIYPKDRHDPLGPVWVYLFALVLFFVRFGYGFALGDQDEFIPFILHRLDPSLLSNDWFVGTQLSFSVRSMFVELLLPLCRLFPVEDVVLWLYLVLWFVIAIGAFRLLRTFGIDRVAAAGAVVLSLGVLHKWTLGSNDLVYSMLVPEMAAWALALPAVVMFVTRRHADQVSARGNLRYFLWPLLLGLAAWYQLLVGLLVFGCLFVIHIWDLLRSDPPRTSWRRIALSFAVFAAASLPVTIPILSSQMTSPDVGEGPSIFYILAPFRNPVHHMLLSFPGKSVIRFAVMAVAAAGSLVWLDRKGLVRRATFLYRLGILILVGCLVMFVFTELYPILFIAKFQFYKLTVLFKLLAIGLIGAVVVSMLPSRLTAFGESLLEPGRIRLAVTAGLVVLTSIFWMTSPTLVERRIMLEVHQASDLGQMEHWIAENTDRSAVFAIPPSNSTFRSNARRAIVVNFMAFPFTDPEMVEWFRRIQAVAPIGRPETGLDVRPELDYAFEHLDASDLRDLARSYDVEYVLRQTPVEGLEPVKAIGAWILYRVG